MTRPTLLFDPEDSGTIAGIHSFDTEEHMPTDNVVIHRFPTLSDSTNWFEVAIRTKEDGTREPVYVGRFDTIWAETLDGPPEQKVSPRVLGYIANAIERENAEGVDGMAQMPVVEGRRLVVHPPS